MAPLEEHEVPDRTPFTCAVRLYFIRCALVWVYLCAKRRDVEDRLELDKEHSEQIDVRSESACDFLRKHDLSEVLLSAIPESPNAPF